MDATRYARVRELFLAADELPDAEFPDADLPDGETASLREGRA